MASELHIRPASRSDAEALAALTRRAGEHCQTPCLVAVVDGRIQAAMSLRGGPVIADPAILGTGVTGRLRLAAAEEIVRRQTREQRARSRRLRSTFGRIGG